MKQHAKDHEENPEGRGAWWMSLTVRSAPMGEAHDERDSARNSYRMWLDGAVPANHSLLTLPNQDAAQYCHLLTRDPDTAKKHKWMTGRVLLISIAYGWRVYFNRGVYAGTSITRLAKPRPCRWGDVWPSPQAPNPYGNHQARDAPPSTRGRTTEL